MEDEMIVTIVNVYVKKEHIEDFIRETELNHKGSIKEPENLRFDVLQSQSDPTNFVLYEAYRSEEGAKAHKETTHYLKWKEAVEKWMDKPRQSNRYNIIAPNNL
jgi:autoinducer 2-degrading protein